MTESNLPIVSFDGGSDDPDELIKGVIAKCIDDRWSAKDGSIFTPAMQFLCLGITQALQCWRDGMISETIVKKAGKPLRDVDELNAQVPEEEWEAGPDGKPRPPWQHVRVVYLLRTSDAAMYTYLNSTVGAHIAVRRLSDQVQAMRHLRGANVAPIVTLGSKQMQTRYGDRLRPHFEIVEWRELNGGDSQSAPPQIEPPKTSGPKTSGSVEQIGKPVKPVTLKEEMNDEIGF
jgi:hypothetical protein